MTICKLEGGEMINVMKRLLFVVLLPVVVIYVVGILFLSLITFIVLLLPNFIFCGKFASYEDIADYLFRKTFERSIYNKMEGLIDEN